MAEGGVRCSVGWKGNLLIVSKCVWVCVCVKRSVDGKRLHDTKRRSLFVEVFFASHPPTFSARSFVRREGRKSEGKRNRERE